MTERFTVRLDEEAAEWVEAEADARDRSKAWIIQQAVAGARGTDSVFTDADHTAPVRTGAHLEDRLDELEARLAALEADEPAPAEADNERGATTDGAGEVRTPDPKSAEPTNGGTGHTAPREDSDTRTESSTDDLAEAIYTQIPKDCPDADAAAVVAIAEFLRNEPGQWASPKEIRDDVRADHPAGKENPEYWWKRMDEWLKHVDEVERVHQRRVEWAASKDVDTGGVYDPTEEF